MPVEIARVPLEALESFYRQTQREALKFFYEFAVVWHEQSYGIAARDGETIVGAATVRVAASLGHVDRVVVHPEYRRRGIGKGLLAQATEVANYYNCHKMTVLVPHLGEAQRFFEACDYHVEAVLLQHTFKKDMAVMRQFML